MSQTNEYPQSDYKQFDDDDDILFFAETDNCSTIKSLIEGIKEFSQEMSIYLTEQSMHIIVVSKLDGSRIDCVLDADKFSHYKLNLTGMSSYATLRNPDGTELKMKRIFIHTGPLQKLFKNVKSQNVIRFLLVRGDEMTFKIDSINRSSHGGVRFTIKQLKDDADDTKFLKKVSYQHVISLTTANLKEKVGHMKSVSGAMYVDIIYNSKVLIFTATGELTKIESIEQQIKNENNDTENTLIAPCVKRIELGCLNGIVKFCNISTRVEMHIDDTYPLLFAFDIADFGRLVVVPAQLIDPK